MGHTLLECFVGLGYLNTIRLFLVCLAGGETERKSNTGLVSHSRLTSRIHMLPKTKSLPSADRGETSVHPWRTVCPWARIYSSKKHMQASAKIIYFHEWCDLGADWINPKPELPQVSTFVSSHASLPPI